MLSIGKVGGGHASPSYYVESVAQGAEDYYAGHGEARGQWWGRGAAARQLSGSVKDDDFLALLEADPGQCKSVLAHDLTFSAPKSVSLLYGLGDDELSRTVRGAHDEAVTQALGYVEDNACWTRRGAGGRRVIRGDGLTVAMFRHRTSRAGDPQLHTHAVVANATSAEGRTTTVYGRSLYAHARTAGFLYQAALRAELTERLGVAWQPVENGMAEIAGFDAQVLQHFSQRSQDIERHLDERGVHSRKAARIAKLETRRTKDYDVPLGELRQQWKARAAEHGLGRDELADVLDRRTSSKPLEPDIEQAAEQLASPDGITRQASTFDRRDAVRDWAAAHRDGAHVDRVTGLADRWLASEHATSLETTAKDPALGGPRFSTPDMLATEQLLLASANERRNTGVARVPPGPHPSPLSEEQRAAVWQLTTSGNGVDVLRAAAGTGKTFALNEARRTWEDANVRVFGCALAARAALELETSAGIDSATIASVERDLDEGHGLPHGSVLVVDEAGMVGTRSLARLAEHCAATDSKLVLVGDDRQLPEIDAGGAFRRLADEHCVVELRDVRRQAEDWDKQALGHLREGRLERWADDYRARGRIVAAPKATELRDRLVEDWWRAARDPECDAVMIAHRRVDVAELNARARTLMREDDRLGKDEVRTPDGRPFATGDEVITKRNDRGQRLVNGTRATVTGVDTEHRTVELGLRDGSTRTVPAGYLDDGSLQHGYAVTAHAAQGVTVDRAFVLGSDDLYREWGYTALSRHREQATYYVVSPASVEQALPGLEPAEDRLGDDIVGPLSRSGRKETAEEIAGPSQAEKAAQGALERAANLERRIGELKPWQRKLGKELRASLARQVKDAERWATRALEEPPPRMNTSVGRKPEISRDALRGLLHDPGKAVEAAIGSRPSPLAGRDRWMRAATRLVQDPGLARDVGPVDRGPDLGMDHGIDIGM